MWTGCFEGIEQVLPTYEEATEWIKRDQCSHGQDCNDCWGSDAIKCMAIPSFKEWTRGKELEKKTNNNHFPFHTCNISWRCGIHKAKFPTFITRKNGMWEVYTEYSNGTEMIIDSRDYWKSRDLVMKKITKPEIRTDQIEIACFDIKDKDLACYDAELGNFMEFRTNWTCVGKTCYHINSNSSPKLLSASRGHSYVQLKAPSMEDLKEAIITEHLLSEEMRYNFGQILA